MLRRAEQFSPFGCGARGPIGEDMSHRRPATPAELSARISEHHRSVGAVALQAERQTQTLTAVEAMAQDCPNWGEQVLESNWIAQQDAAAASALEFARPEISLSHSA